MSSSTTQPYLSLESKESLSPEEMANMDREYEFFITTEEPHQPEGVERGRIRRLVMRNFFETKWSGPSNNSSKHHSASTVQAKTSLKSRFRLPKPGQETIDARAKPKCKKTPRRQSQEEEEKKERRPGTTRKLSGLSDVSQLEAKRSASSRRASPAGRDAVEIGKSEEETKLVLNINPNAHRFDPFDVLPVPGTPQLDILFRLYKCGSRANSIAINARNTWWSFISHDAGLLHATLATWALYGMLIRGMSGLHIDQLRHKNEAIKEINTKIGDPGGGISDELVGTVSTLASFENLLGAYDAAQLHIAALKRMVNARGGLFAFGHNDGLIRGILWVDFHTAAAFRLPPSFPRIRLDPDTPPLPEALLEEAAYTSPTSLLQLSVASIDCFNIFYRLHRLGLAVSSRWIRKVNRLTFSNLLYETEHTILSVPDKSRDFLDFDLEPHDEHSEDFDERGNLADGASVTEALLAATQIFLYAALREMPPKAKIFSILLERLRVALDRPKVSTIEIWIAAKNLNTLLWVLVVASVVAPSWGGRSWWIGRLSDVIEEVNIRSQTELERILERIAWTDVVFGDALDGVWDEVGEYARGVERAQNCQARERSTEPEEELVATGTVAPRLLEAHQEKGLVVPVRFDSGRWKVNGWYV